MSRRWAFLRRRASSFSGDVTGDRMLSCHRDDGMDEDDGDRWSRLLPELLTDIIRRVEESEDRWPRRRSVVACACVCRKWREITTGLVRSKPLSGLITFPSSIKQPGPKDTMMQCFIKRKKRSSTFYLYLGMADTFVDKGKFLMAAQRYRTGAHTEYVLSMDYDDLSQRSNAYMGKLRSDFFGTKFTFYDSQPPYPSAKASSSRSGRRFTSKQISPQVSAGNFKVGHISYQFNLLKSRGPRRMLCTLQLPSKTDAAEPKSKSCGPQPPLVMKNKTPRWHEHLQCWCLNFHGRVTVASVKNFQLVAVGEEELVLLQFGKFGDDLFTMDYRHPLSAFQAFVICLTSFGTKIACE
ncbi:hypothetical protein HPP92_009855 [Vanilla planifolia]|uniref:Tubby C-terminal domain-containing protein n=1 Tax=Vanilla planifolia TaxID=51239 RepID=A0A835R8W5_VANPL|nr:hypothetical protein HPP92_009855 [Vanilla planifolia]